MARASVAALENAKRLLKDARALLALGSAPTAASLAVLAMEEASKANDWHGIAATSGDASLDLPQKKHKDKLRPVRQRFGLLHAFDQLMHDPDGYKAEPDESSPPRVDQETSNDNALKQQGFYVDVNGEQVLEPSLITAPQAQAMVDDAANAIFMMEREMH